MGLKHRVSILDKWLFRRKERNPFPGTHITREIASALGSKPFQIHSITLLLVTSPRSTSTFARFYTDREDGHIITHYSTYRVVRKLYVRTRLRLLGVAFCDSPPLLKKSGLVLPEEGLRIHVGFLLLSRLTNLNFKATRSEAEMTRGKERILSKVSDDKAGIASYAETMWCNAMETSATTFLGTHQNIKQIAGHSL